MIWEELAAGIGPANNALFSTIERYRVTICVTKYALKKPAENPRPTTILQMLHWLFGSSSAGLSPAHAGRLSA